ncbi:MAG: hypothetical protein IPQ16_15145 [Geobacteraceae bacterium]|nr:hypothetical protein [Geobacteraceae bacterium]
MPDFRMEAIGCPAGERSAGGIQPSKAASGGNARLFILIALGTAGEDVFSKSADHAIVH